MKKIAFLLLGVLTCMSVSAQILNPGFEDWDSSASNGSIYPPGWNNLEHTYHHRSSDACANEYALTVSAWYAYLATRAIQQIPTNQRPSSLNGCYKYTENLVEHAATDIMVTDTALAIVFMTRWNATLHKRDTVGSGKSDLHQSLSFSHFSCPISYASTDMPDSAIIILDPSLVRRYSHRYYNAYNFDRCSFLTVDDLELSNSPTGIPGTSGDGDFQIYPNPANEIITIASRTAGRTLAISDAFGRTILRVNTTSQQENINVSTFPPGVYMITCYDERGNKLHTGKFSKQ